MNTYIKQALVDVRFAFIALLMLTAPALIAAPFTLGLNNGGGTVEEFSLPVGKSEIIQSTQPLSQVVIGNPDTADVRLLNSKQFLVLGKKPGTTNVAFKDTHSRIVAVLDVVVGFDLDAIKRKLNEVLPDEKAIEVRSSNGNVMLSGEVTSASALDKVLAVTDSFAKGSVINLLQVGGGQQVLLEVRIAEVKRNKINNLGVQNSIIGTAGAENGISLYTGTPLSSAFGGGLVLNSTSISKNLETTLEALEQNGSAQVLAEPNITALSGQEASFLVGGEFPVPVAQTGAYAGAISIDYKEFGVGLKFTPTVLSSKRINLRLNTEVSDIDSTTGTSVLGTTVPGLRTRRAATTIELGDGNSFAIAGLLQNDMGAVVKEFPGLGRIPVLGALFRSSEFKRDETELVIVVTPRLVHSVDRGAIKLPTDGYRPPSRWDLYGMGRIEAPARPAEHAPATPASESTEEGGLDGAQGHQF